MSSLCGVEAAEDEAAHRDGLGDLIAQFGSGSGEGEEFHSAVLAWNAGDEPALFELIGEGGDVRTLADEAGSDIAHGCGRVE